MIVQYEDLLIREMTLEDGHQLLQWYNDGNIMAYDGYPQGKKTNLTIVQHYISHDSRRFRHMIEYKGEPIGEVNYRDLKDGTCQIDLLIAQEKCQNKGLGKIILSLFIDVLFYDLGFKKIRLETFKSNPRSIHVFESLGFKKVQEHENNRHSQDGSLMSTLDYELVLEDFNSYI